MANKNTIIIAVVAIVIVAVAAVAIVMTQNGGGGGDEPKAFSITTAVRRSFSYTVDRPAAAIPSGKVCFHVFFIDLFTAYMTIAITAMTMNNCLI